MISRTPTRQTGLVTRHFDLAILGSGSGNSIADERFADWSVAIVEEGVFGGTCLNRGCIPTKMFVYPADLALAARHGGVLGVHTHFDSADWVAMRDRIFARIDPISAGGREWRADGAEHVTLYERHARFVDPHTIDLGEGEQITADRIVLATGSRPEFPPVPGLDEVEAYTSDTIMRIDALPERLLILGGGVISAEFAHIFSAFGTQVTIVNRSPLLLGKEDHDVAERFTEVAQDRWEVHLGRLVSTISRVGDGVRAELDDGTVLEADAVLVATGRRPNSDLLDLAAAGVEVDENGVVVVDEHQRTSLAHIFALGDVSNPWQLKHVANAEARAVAHNLLHPEQLLSPEHVVVPSAVFTNPQIASVGMTEREAEASGLRFTMKRQAYGDTAYGWAMEDKTSFAKVIADPGTGRLLGAHILGPQASNLIQPLIQMMSLGQSIPDVSRGQYWIHPAMMEVVENALLGLEIDVAAEHLTAQPEGRTL